MSHTGWVAAAQAEDTAWIAVEEHSAVSAAGRRVATMAEQLGFPPERAAQAALLATEAASNLHKHARTGVMHLRKARHGGAPSIELICMDSGPGMADVGVSMRDGHSTSGTLGIGLGAIARLADESDVHSVRARGTVLTARIGATPGTGGPGPAGCSYAGLIRPITGEVSCGDAFAAWSYDGTCYGMLCDGLGHGPLAEIAAREAVRTVRELPVPDGPGGPAAIVDSVHRRLGRTRGGAVAVAAAGGGRVVFAGLGNVAGWIAGPDGRQGLVSTPGIAGHERRTLREYGHDLPRGAIVILHSDGLTGRWNLSSYPGLISRAPLTIAATLLRDAGVRRDDGGVLVLRPSPP